MKSKLLSSDGELIVHELTLSEPMSLEQFISWILKDDPHARGKISIRNDKFKKITFVTYKANQFPNETFSDKDLLGRDVGYALSVRHAWSGIVDYTVVLKETPTDE